MPTYRIVFEANKLHEIGRPISNHEETVEAIDSNGAIRSLYHKYEHVEVLKVERVHVIAVMGSNKLISTEDMLAIKSAGYALGVDPIVIINDIERSIQQSNTADLSRLLREEPNQHEKVSNKTYAKFLPKTIGKQRRNR